MESTRTEIHSAFFGTVIFSDSVNGVKHCVETILKNRMDLMDDYLNEHAMKVLFGQHDEGAFFKFLSEVCWDFHNDMVIELPYYFMNTLSDHLDSETEFNNIVTELSISYQQLKNGVMESQTLNLSELPSIVQHLPNVVSYSDVMASLKPVSTITGLYNIYQSGVSQDSLAEIIKLLEIHNVLWHLDTDKLMISVEVILELVKNIKDVPDLLKQFVSGEDGISASPKSVMSSEFIELDDEGMLKKAILFVEKFGLDINISEHGSIIALLTTVVASLGLFLGGNKIFNFGSGLQTTLHEMALECRDYKILLTSVQDTWKFVASYLGKFLGFTYMDEHQQARQQLKGRLDAVRDRLEKMENNREIDYDRIGDPAFYEDFFTEIKHIRELINDMCKTSENYASFRTDLKEVEDRVTKIREEYVCLINSVCGKQLPVTMYIASEKKGVGKTSFNEWMTEELSTYYGKVLTKYTKNFLEKYWSSYAYQSIVHGRDFNQSLTNDEHNDLVSMYDGTSYQLAMSSDKQKGRCFKSVFVFIDSNTKYIRRSAAISQPDALDRRRDFLFEAFSDYVPTPEHPTPASHDEAIKHLILMSDSIIADDMLPQEIRGAFQKKYYTIDGRETKVMGSSSYKLIKTSKFTEIAEQLYQLETTRHAEYLTKIKNTMRKFKDFSSQSITPAISRAESSYRKIFVFCGEPGTGKTHLAKQYRNEPTHDEFTLNLRNADHFILNQYDNGEKLVILTTNKRDFEEWKTGISVTSADWERIQRRINFVEFSYNKQNLFTRYTKEDVAKCPSNYTTYVKHHVNGIRTPYVDLISMLEDSAASTAVSSVMYKNVPRIRIETDSVRNLVTIDIPWIDADQLSFFSLPALLNKIKIVKSEFQLITIMNAFKSIVRDVFSKYQMKQNLESGLNQLNSLRITSPLEFDCVVKFQDEVFFMTTDPEGKLVFCICDDSFTYQVEDGVVKCYLNNTYMWEVTGKVSDWYQHIIKKSEKVQIHYEHLTPMSSEFKNKCDHFMNFMKTALAAYSIYRLCKPKATKVIAPSEIVLNQYDNFNYSKPPNFSVSNGESSADNYMDKGNRAVPKTLKQSSKFAFKQGWKNSADKYDYDSEAALDLTAMKIAEIVMEQNYPVVVNGKQICHCNGVFKNFVITVGHITNQVQVRIDGTDFNTEIVAIDEVRDLAILKVIGFTGNFKDIRKYFQRERADQTITGQPAFLFTWSDNRKYIKEKPILVREMCHRETSTGEKFGYVYKVNALSHVSPIQTVAGYCGSPLIINNPRYSHKLLGFHVAADQVEGLSSIVYQNDFDFVEVVAPLNSEVQDITILSFQQVIPTTDELPDGFSPLLKMVGYPGTETGGKRKINYIHHSNQTQLHVSPFNTGEFTFEPAVLSERDQRLEVEVQNLLIAGINKFAREQKPLDLSVLDECYEELGDHLVNIIKEASIETKIFSELEVINGCSVYTSSPSINMSSGVGYPHSFEHKNNNTKGDMFYFNSDKNRYEFSTNANGQTLVSDYLSYLDYLKSNEGQCAVIYIAAKKDECRKIAKIETGQTRVFEMGPLYHFMAMKKYFGGAQAALTMVNSRSPFKIGINASSVEYASLYKYLRRTGTQGINGDYKGFDTTTPYAYLERHPRIYNKIYQQTDPDWQPEDDMMRERLYAQESKPLVLVNDIIVQLPGGNMSGSEDTGPKNNITGAINMRYAYKILARQHAPQLYYKYDEYTTDACFGDDIIKTIADDILSWYNAKSIQQILTDIGFVFTSADKEAELVIQPLEELSFLKRNFSNVEITIGGVNRTVLVGALEDECFCKMLNWCKTTKRWHFKRGVPNEQGSWDCTSTQLDFDRSTIGLTALTALSEACLKGKDFFESIKQHLEMCAKQHDIILPPLPRFEQAFFETYYRSEFPQNVQYKTLIMPPNHPLSINREEAFEYKGKTFKSIIQCYEYRRAIFHNRYDDAMEILAGKSIKQISKRYSQNVNFKPDNLMMKIIRHRFSNVTYKIDDDEMLVCKYPHPHFGFITEYNCKNQYGRLLSQFFKVRNNGLTSEILNFHSKEGDVLDSPYSICHCVSADFKMSKGVALAIKEKFGDFKVKGAKVGEVFVNKLQDKRIYYLVTKRFFDDKPLIKDIITCLKQLCLIATYDRDLFLSMPLICTGLDKLRWGEVQQNIMQTFAGSDISVIAYKRKPPQLSKEIEHVSSYAKAKLAPSSIQNKITSQRPTAKKFVNSLNSILNNTCSYNHNLKYGFDGQQPSNAGNNWREGDRIGVFEH